MLNETIVSEIATKLGMPEVLEQFLKSDAPADGVNPFAEKLGLFELFTATDLTARISNESKIAAAQAAKDATGNTYGAIDTRTLKATAIAKNPGESTVDYTERAFKEKFGTAGDESEDLKRLKADIAAKDVLLLTKESKLSEMEATYATEKKAAQINAKLDTRINALTIDIPATVAAADRPAYLDNQREFVKYKLMQAYEVDVVEGKTQFTDKATGQVVRDAKTAAPITEAALIEVFAPKVVSLKKVSAVQPSGYQSGANSPTGDGAASFDYSQYATKADFAKALNAQGIGSGTPEGAKFYGEFLKARPDAK